jgi:hypothetical protein
VPLSSGASSPRNLLDCKIDYYAPLVRYAVSTAKYLPAFRISALHPFSFVRRHSHKIWHNIVTNDWNQQGVQCWWFNKGNIYAPYLALHIPQNRCTFQTLFIYIPRVVSLPFPPLSSRTENSTSKHRRILTSVFFFTALINKNTFPSMCHERSKRSALYQHLRARSSLFPCCCCLLPCFFRWASDCTYTSYRYVRGLSIDDVVTGSIVTKISNTFYQPFALLGVLHIVRRRKLP